MYVISSLHRSANVSDTCPHHLNLAAVIVKPSPAFSEVGAERGEATSLVARIYGSTAALTGVVALIGVGA